MILPTQFAFIFHQVKAVINYLGILIFFRKHFGLASFTVSHLIGLPRHNECDLFVIDTSGWLVPGSDFRNCHILGELYFPNINVRDQMLFPPPEKCLCVKCQQYKCIPNFIAGMTKYRMEQTLMTSWSQKQQD